MTPGLPPHLQPVMARARRLEWWSIGWTVSVILVMGAATGQSQTMKTAWVEDCLSLVPPIVFLVSAWIERRPPSSRFPAGFGRAPGLAFAIAAAALAALGATLLVDSAWSLFTREHATVAEVRVLGRDVWLGWLMEAAQVYSILVPLVLGWLKLPVARELHDKTLFTDAQTQKANWLTGVAGLGGVLGIGVGWWWADSVAAGLIALDILNDGVRALRSAGAELVDGAPRELESCEVDAEARAVEAELRRRFPGAAVRLRETGRVVRAEVDAPAPPGPPATAGYWPGPPERAWRLASVAFAPPARGGDGGA